MKYNSAIFLHVTSPNFSQIFQNPLYICYYVLLYYFSKIHFIIILRNLCIRHQIRGRSKIIYILYIITDRETRGFHNSSSGVAITHVPCRKREKRERIAAAYELNQRSSFSIHVFVLYAFALQ